MVGLGGGLLGRYGVPRLHFGARQVGRPQPVMHHGHRRRGGEDHDDVENQRRVGPGHREHRREDENGQAYGGEAGGPADGGGGVGEGRGRGGEGGVGRGRGGTGRRSAGRVCGHGPGGPTSRRPQARGNRRNRPAGAGRRGRLAAGSARTGRTRAAGGAGM
ncbi:hypothetical protein ACU686_22460 [Yinghuangia aomiensis]